MFARVLSLLVLVVACASAALFGGWWKLELWSKTPREIAQEQIVELPAGTALARFAQTLEAQGVIDSAPMFHAWVRLHRSYPSFQAGKYRFVGPKSPAEIEQDIIKGNAFVPTVLTITIPEGFQQKQILERLAANEVGTLEELKALASDPEFLRGLGIQAKNLEGYLYPATYPFTEKPTSRQALERMVRHFFNMLPKNYEDMVRAKGLTLHQAVTFASLIELETRRDDERDLVSEVIWRRLKESIPLGIDAAIIYGIADYAGDLRTIHLTDAKNPYNSRIHKGLPPSPIGSPSAKSLAAVLTPSNHGYYFYVLRAGTDQHHFSKTLKEHNQHVRKLVNAMKRGSRSNQD